MALMPTNQRDQAMVAVTLVMLGLVGVFYTYYWSPRNDTLAIQQARVDTLVTQNDAARRETARGNAKQLREEAEQYGQMLAVMRQLVPTENEVATLVDQISTAARRVGLDVGQLEPMGVVPGDVYDTHKFRIVVTGSYHRIAELLANVGSLTRIVAPMNLTLNPAAQTRVRLRPDEQALDATFEIQTYVAKSSAPGAAR